MKIAQLTPYLSPEYGSYEYELSKALIKKGCEVTIFSSLKPDPRYYPSHKKSSLTGFCKINGVKIIRCKTIWSMGEHEGVPISLELLPRTAFSHFDVFHTHDFHQFSSLAAFLSSKLRKKPFVITQNAYADMPLLYSTKRVYFEAFRLFKASVGRTVLDGADHFIALTSLAKNYLIKLGVPEDKITIIPIGVDENKFLPLNNKTAYREKLKLVDNPVVLCVSRLIRNKGIHTLLQAFKKVVLAVPNSRLVVVGKGRYFAELARLTDVLRLREKVHFIKFIPHQDVHSVYTMADVFVLPTLLVEVFGIVVVEAMMSELPVIASKLGGIQDIIIDRECGFLVPPNNPDAIADKIILLLTDRGLRRRLGRNARKRAIEKYSWSVIAEKTIRIYKELMRR